MIAPTRVTALAWFQNTLWAASYGRGLYVNNGAGWRPAPIRTSRYITCLSSDGQRLWYGTWMTGQVGYIDTELRHQIIPLPRLITPRFAFRVNCLTVDESAVWYGTDGYLLNYNIDNSEWASVLNLGTIVALAKMGSFLWVGTEDSLISVAKSRELPYEIRVLRENVKVSSIYPATESLYLGVYERGGWYIQEYSPKTERLSVLDGKLPGWISGIAASKNKIFAAVGSRDITQVKHTEFVEGGLFVLDCHKGVWVKERSAKVTDAWCLLKVNDTLWVGGYSGIQQLRAVED